MLTKPRLDNVGDLDLGEITLAERLFLWRHRQLASNGRLMGRSGSTMSQAEAAAALGLDPGLYHRIENGVEPRVTYRYTERGAVVEVGERVLGALNRLRSVESTPGETCLIARRRSGLALREITAALGITTPTFHAWERAADPRVVAWWEGRGFRFPK